MATRRETITIEPGSVDHARIKKINAEASKLRSETRGLAKTRRTTNDLTVLKAITARMESINQELVVLFDEMDSLTVHNDSWKAEREANETLSILAKKLKPKVSMPRKFRITTIRHYDDVGASCQTTSWPQTENIMVIDDNGVVCCNLESGFWPSGRYEISYESISTSPATIKYQNTFQVKGVKSK